MALNVLRPKAQIAKLGVGRTLYYVLKKTDPTFPKDVILGERAVGKFEHELDAWLESRREGRTIPASATALKTTNTAPAPATTRKNASKSTIAAKG